MSTNLGPMRNGRDDRERQDERDHRAAEGYRQMDHKNTTTDEEEPYGYVIGSDEYRPPEEAEYVTETETDLTPPPRQSSRLDNTDVDDIRDAFHPAVVLHNVVDIEGATEDQEEMYEEMADLFEGAFETFVEKNLDYGSSFLTAGEVEQALDQGDGPFESAMEANLYKLFTRIQDKDQRFYNLAFDGGEDHVGEAAMDTAVDAAVYWFMVAWLLSREEES